jgi:hypothetical protein
MWFDFKKMFDQIAKHIRHVKKLGKKYVIFFVDWVHALMNNMFIIIIRKLIISYII